MTISLIMNFNVSVKGWSTLLYLGRPLAPFIVTAQVATFSIFLFSLFVKCLLISLITDLSKLENVL